MLQMLGTGMMDPSQQTPSFVDPAQLSRAHRWYVVQHASLIRSWLGNLYSESLQAALAGDPDPGSKAIEGAEGRRFFKDMPTARHLMQESLGDAAFKPAPLIGFTEIDKIVKPGKKKKGHPDLWEALQPLIDRKPGTAKLVGSDHPAPALVRDYGSDDEFEDLEN
jgi:hypothetical protein